MGWYGRRPRRVRDLPRGDARIFLQIDLRRVRCKGCRQVKSEGLDFLADNPLCTKRFAYYVGRRCRQAAIRDVAEELRLHWETIKALEMQYMRAQLAKAGAPGPKSIGIDEISPACSPSSKRPQHHPLYSVKTHFVSSTRYVGST